jgi:hypothetical protein
MTMYITTPRPSHFREFLVKFLKLEHNRHGNSQVFENISTCINPYREDQELRKTYYYRKRMPIQGGAAPRSNTQASN